MIDRAARRDVGVGIGTAILVTLIGLVVVPVYVRLLGVEAYGLVGFLAVLQSVVALIDLGLAPTASREVARGVGIGDLREVRLLIANLARIYWALAVAIAAVGTAAAPLIAGHWLDPRSLPPETVTRAVMLMAGILAFRWPSGLYGGVLIGGHRMVAANLVNLAATAATAVAGVAAVYMTRRVEALFVVSIATAAVQALVMRALCWRLIGAPERASWTLAPVKRVWRYSAGMGIIAILAVVVSQLDKIVVSSLLSLQAFGAYALANVVGRALYQLISPVYSAVHPRLSAMVAGGREGDLLTSYLAWSGLFCAVFLPMSLFLILAAEPLVTLWLGNPAVAAEVAPLAGLIAAGSALHGVMFFPFALQVAVGDVRTPITINTAVAILYVPLLVAFTLTYGLIGAAAAWPVLMTAYVLLAVWLTHRRVLVPARRPWLMWEVGAPAAACVGVGLLAGLLPRAPGLWQQIGVAAAASALAGALCIGLVVARHRRVLRTAELG